MSPRRLRSSQKKNQRNTDSKDERLSSPSLTSPPAVSLTEIPNTIGKQIGESSGNSKSKPTDVVAAGKHILRNQFTTEQRNAAYMTPVPSPSPTDYIMSMPSPQSTQRRPSQTFDGTSPPYISSSPATIQTPDHTEEVYNTLPVMGPPQFPPAQRTPKPHAAASLYPYREIESSKLRGKKSNGDGVIHNNQPALSPNFQISPSNRRPRSDTPYPWSLGNNGNSFDYNVSPTRASSNQPSLNTSMPLDLSPRNRRSPLHELNSDENNRTSLSADSPTVSQESYSPPHQQKRKNRKRKPKTPKSRAVTSPSNESNDGMDVDDNQGVSNIACGSVNVSQIPGKDQTSAKHSKSRPKTPNRKRNASASQNVGGPVASTSTQLDTTRNQTTHPRSARTNRMTNSARNNVVSEEDVIISMLTSPNPQDREQIVNQFRNFVLSSPVDEMLMLLSDPVDFSQPNPENN